LGSRWRRDIEKQRAAAPASLSKRKGLALSRGLSLEGSNDLFQFLSSTFWALCFPFIVFLHAKNERKLLIAFETSIIIGRHPFSLLSL
jgi:hypothetical protein